MRYAIMMKSKEVIVTLNIYLLSDRNTEMYSIEHIDTVPRGKGYRRDQLYFTISKAGDYMTKVRIDTELLSFIESYPIGNYTETDKEMIKIDMKILLNFYLKSAIQEVL